MEYIVCDLHGIELSRSDSKYKAIYTAHMGGMERGYVYTYQNGTCIEAEPVKNGHINWY